MKGLSFSSILHKGIRSPHARTFRLAPAAQLPVSFVTQ